MEVQTTVWATHKNTWTQQTRGDGADKTFHRTCQHNKKVTTFENTWLCTCNQYRFEKYVRSFVWCIFLFFFFLSLHKFNSITSYSIILYHNYLNKEIFRKDLQSVLIFRVHKFKRPVGFLKHPCEQCSSLLDISSVSLETCYSFLRFDVIIFHSAIFLPIFNFTIITRHNVMTCDLESHNIAINVVWACDNHTCGVFFNGRPG